MHMKIITDYKACPDYARNSVIALGNFDSVHKGHQVIIGQAIKNAKKLGVPSAVMTFEPHPLSLFKPDSEKFRTTLFEKKSSLIESLGADVLFSIDFNKNFSEITADDFVQMILIKCLEVRKVIIGHDFIFGHKRGGDANLLKKYADKGSFEFLQIDAVGNQGNVFSTTKIRQCLRAGKIKQANEILGRNFSIIGKVEHGEKRGRQLGFSTANISLGDHISPKHGVYACKLNIDGVGYTAVANIGIKPTFENSKELLELHIFDFKQDIYGKTLEVELVDYIRDEIKFSSFEQLKSQIENDCTEARLRLM